VDPPSASADDCTRSMTLCGPRPGNAHASEVYPTWTRYLAIWISLSSTLSRATGKVSRRMPRGATLPTDRYDAYGKCGFHSDSGDADSQLVVLERNARHSG